MTALLEIAFSSSLCVGNILALRERVDADFNGTRIDSRGMKNTRDCVHERSHKTISRTRASLDDFKHISLEAVALHTDTALNMGFSTYIVPNVPFGSIDYMYSPLTMTKLVLQGKSRSPAPVNTALVDGS